MPIIKINMPLEERKHVLKYQAELKIRKGIGSYSQQSTIFAIIREHEEFCKQRKLSNNLLAFNK